MQEPIQVPLVSGDLESDGSSRKPTASRRNLIGGCVLLFLLTGGGITLLLLKIFRPPLITPQPAVPTFPATTNVVKDEPSLTLYARSYMPYGTNHLQDGSATCDVYLTLMLTVKEDHAPFDKMVVEPHWVGEVEVWATGPPGKIMWQVEPNEPPNLAPLPERPSDFLLSRVGLQPTTITTPDPVLRPMWWAEWQARSAGSSVAADLPPNHLPILRDFGPVMPRREKSVVVVRDAAGNERRLTITWHPPSQCYFRFTLSLVDVKDKNGRPLPDNYYPVEVDAVRQRLARLMWVQSVKGLPEGKGMTPLPLTIDVICSHRVTADFFSNKLQDTLSDVVQASRHGKRAPRLRLPF